MRGLINFVAVIAIIQGVGGFVGETWFASSWGFLHRLVDLPAPGYLAVAVAGVVVLVAVDTAKKRDSA